MDRLPKLKEVQCTKMNFQPGDRILVRCHQPLSREQVRNMQKAIEKWAGDGVPVLFFPSHLMEMSVDQSKRILE